MGFNVNDFLSLVDGINTYQVIGRDGDYLKLVCTDFDVPEFITYDLTVYSHNTEFWVKRDDLHLFELMG